MRLGHVPVFLFSWQFNLLTIGKGPRNKSAIIAFVPEIYLVSATQNSVFTFHYSDFDYVRLNSVSNNAFSNYYDTDVVVNNVLMKSFFVSLHLTPDGSIDE